MEAEVMEDVLQVVSGDAALRKVAISADLAPGLPKILGDRIHSQPVLLNFILNGMDAMAGEPGVRAGQQVAAFAALQFCFGEKFRLRIAFCAAATIQNTGVCRSWPVRRAVFTTVWLTKDTNVRLPLSPALSLFDRTTIGGN
jgi:hypothetical protein